MTDHQWLKLLMTGTNFQGLDQRAGPRCLVVRKGDARFQTAVVRASIGSHVGKQSSAYGWSGGFSPGFPVFAHL